MKQAHYHQELLLFPESLQLLYLLDNYMKQLETLIFLITEPNRLTNTHHSQQEADLVSLPTIRNYIIPLQ